ncbi:Hypothetical protein NTJ_13045 [Nesidiocoris tenuis]|uniref:Uncharacterized protein n=1 Tax=Nesidiocoris tenuis TaxID=355587 RepID=A0ABN7B759_9HEMI|nr:Hypothetical protein NTJ_13045 [Nesidiocoris tenuis]
MCAKTNSRNLLTVFVEHQMWICHKFDTRCRGSELTIDILKRTTRDEFWDIDSQLTVLRYEVWPGQRDGDVIPARPVLSEEDYNSTLAGRSGSLSL